MERQGTLTPQPFWWRVGFGSFALHLWLLWALAASNILLGVAALAAAFGRYGRGVCLPRAPALLHALGWLVLLFLLSIGFSYDPGISLPCLDDLFSLLPLVLTVYFVREERQARFVVTGLVLMGTVLAAVGIVQLAVGVAELDVRSRMPGPFSHYQTFAGVLLLATALLLARLLAPGTPLRPLHLLAMVILGGALVANLTRGSWVALILTMIFVFAHRFPRRVLVVLPVALLVAALFLPMTVLRRAGSIFDLYDESNYERLCMIWSGLHMVAERPLFGIGPGLVEKRYPLYRHPTAPRDRRPHLHNSFLQLAAERGLLSLAAFVALLGVSLRQGLVNYRREGGPNGPRADLHLGAAAALVAYTLAALFEDNWADTEVQRIALFVIALPFSLRSPARDA